jgi:hypothetical protein
MKKWIKELVLRCLDETKYALADGIALIAASLDFLTDVICSRGHPKASWPKYVESGRNMMGWFLFSLDMREVLLKANPNAKFFCNFDGHDMLGNADEMPPEMRQLMRNKDKILKELGIIKPES